MEDHEKEKNTEKNDRVELKDKIQSMFNSIPDEDNMNVSSPLFKKTTVDTKETSLFRRIGKAVIDKISVSLFRKENPAKDGVIGLDIGSDSIKHVLLVEKNGRKVLKSAGAEPIPQEVRSSLTLKNEFIYGYIRDEIAGKFKKTPVYVGFNHPELMIELVKIPKGDGQDIESRILKKTREQLSLTSMDDVSVDYTVLGEEEDLGERMIYALTAVIPGQIFYNFIEGVFKTGINIKAVEPDILALYAMLDTTDSLKTNGFTIVLDMGASRTSFNIVTNKKLHFSRELPFSGNTVTRAIAELCKVDFLKAQNLKENGDLTRDQQTS